MTRSKGLFKKITEIKGVIIAYSIFYHLQIIYEGLITALDILENEEKQALDNIANNKTAGADEISAKLFKAL